MGTRNRKFKRRSEERGKSFLALALIPFAGFFIINATNPIGKSKPAINLEKEICIEHLPVIQKVTSNEEEYFEFPEPEVPVLFEPVSAEPEFDILTPASVEKKITVAFRHWPQGITTCSISDINGEEHFTLTIRKNQMDGDVEIELPETFNPGRYWMELKMQRYTQNRAFLFGG